MSPSTDNYNLNDKMVKHVDDGKINRVMLLTFSKKEADVKAAIGNDNTLKNSRVPLMDKRVDACTKAEVETQRIIGFLPGH